MRNNITVTPNGIRRQSKTGKPTAHPNSEADKRSPESRYNPAPVVAPSPHGRDSSSDQRPISGSAVQNRRIGSPAVPHQHHASCIAELAAWAKDRAMGSSRMLTSESPQLSRLQCLWTATSDPPITATSLSELDLNRIIHDSKLRHDLNFETDVAFRPNYESCRGQEKMLQAKEYWQALSIELAAYIDYAQQIFSNESANPPVLLLNEPCMAEIPWRVPQLIKTIGKILKTLVPTAEWEAVDRTLDVDLVMQQMRNGAYDLIGFSEWLGAALKRSCSPVRDPDVLNMVRAMQAAVTHNSCWLLALSVERLFSVLETMKLDVANHQIRHLRLPMLNESTQFEQRYFLDRIATGLEVLKAYDWYQIPPRDNAPKPTNDAERLESFSLAVIELVISRENRVFPTTFEFDFDRLQALRYDVREYICQMVCSDAFTKFSTHLGHSGDMPVAATRRLLSRIAQLDESWWNHNTSANRAEKPALEIVREAYRVCAIKTTPNEKDVLKVEHFLIKTFRGHSQPYDDLEWALSQDLERMVHQELRSILMMTPLEILGFYEPRPWSGVEHQHNSLLSIAARIAHITILHWRVWSPILYLQPRENVCNGTLSLEIFRVSEPHSCFALSEDSPRDTRECEAVVGGGISVQF